MSLNAAVLTGVRHAALVGILTLTAGLLTLPAAANEPPGPWQSPQSIRAVARELVLESLGTSNTVSVEAVAVDDRLKLAACSQPLEAHVQRAVQRGQGIVAVSCAGAEPWRLFVPVRVTEQVAVIVTRRTIQSGELLAAEDLDTRTQASSSLPYDYLSDPEQAIGLTVRRTLPTGTVLVPAAIERPELVERGALVTLIAGHGSVVIKSEGVALEPARRNERVRVRSQSGRVVEGVVDASGQVRVGL
jgi:flagella basal body P-ring formation protein FlgA